MGGTIVLSQKTNAPVEDITFEEIAGSWTGSRARRNYVSDFVRSKAQR